MADNNDDLMSQFQEFLTAKAEKEKNDADQEDFELEIFDEKGRGVRTRRSHAKPFLQSLGIDVDPEPPKDDDDDTKAPPKKSSTGRKSSPAANSVTRKYFTPKK